MILITGSNGMLARALKSVFNDARGIDIDTLDISNYSDFEKFLQSIKPKTIIHAAAYTDVEGAEDNPYEAYKGNVLTTESVIKYAVENNVYVIFYSTDYLFHGYRPSLIKETDQINVKGVYAFTKYRAEKIVSSYGNSLIIRTSWLYGEGKKNFVEKIIELMKNKDVIYGAINEVSSPTYTVDLAEATYKLLSLNIKGVVNFSNKGAISRYTWIKEIANLVGYKGNVVPVFQGYFNLKSPRPLFSALSTEYYEKITGEIVPDWKDALGRYIKKRGGNV